MLASLRTTKVNSLFDGVLGSGHDSKVYEVASAVLPCVDAPGVCDPEKHFKLSRTAQVGLLFGVDTIGLDLNKLKDLFRLNSSTKIFRGPRWQT